jgi:putative membrane protein
MRWWCSAIDAPWTWVPRPYLGVWILTIGLLTTYGVAVRRHGRSHPGDRDGRERRRAVWFTLGVAVLWVASDWPVGALGAGYLASVHMTQYMLYTLGAASLLLLGTPEWMARSVLDRTRLTGLYRAVSRPVVAGVVFNVVLIATHAPVTVDSLRSTQVGSFLLDMIWLLSGIVLWSPVISPLPEARGRSAASRIVYLFLACAVLPMIPGGFIAFSPEPLYATYELAPRSIGLNPIDDQQLAGVIMKIGNLPVVWATMAVIWFRWYQQDQAVAERRRRARAAARRATGPAVRPEELRPPAPTGADLN